MEGIELEKGKSKFNFIILWVFGAIFLFLGLILILGKSYFTGLLFIIASVITIPPALTELEKNLKVSLPKVVKFFAVFILVAVAISATPNVPTPANNTTSEIAAPPSSDSGSGAIEVPSEAESIPTPTPALTPTPTSENKGKLDILTSPSGATVTIDGISKGVSPIEGLSVDAGTHSVTVYLLGYYPQKEEVEVANSETKKLAYDLVPETKQDTASTLNQEETSTPETTQTEMATPEATQTPHTAQIIAKWSGNGIKNTETFHVTSDEWYIVWDTKPGQYGDMNFIITVYNADGSIKDLAANVIGASNDHTVERGAGDYYLNINTAQPYTVAVEE